jgi:hypothetical protein
MKRLFAVLMILMLAAGAFFVLPEGEGAPAPTRDSGRTLYVARENSTYFDIDQALGDAQDGDTIYVAPGTYENGMLISINNLTVIGNHTEGDVIVGNNMEAIAGIHAQGVKVSGITFTDEHPHIGIISMSHADGSELTDVSFIAAQIGEGLNIRDSDNVTFRNITVRTNDRQAVRIMRSSNIEFLNFSFSCNTSMGGCFELDMTDNIVLENGNIELRSGGTAIYNLEGGSLSLHRIFADYTEKFIMMETGNISMYNMDIDPADILMDVPDPIHTVRSYFQRNIYMSVEAANGTIGPLEGGHIVITTDGDPVYATEHFNGTDAVSDAEGRFEEPFPFLSWELVGGDSNPRNGINTVTAWFKGDHPAEDNLGIVNANVTEFIDITFTGVYNQTRTIWGGISYENEPTEGSFWINATVFLYGENMTLIDNQTINQEIIIPNMTIPPHSRLVIFGKIYSFQDLPIGVNYTIIAIPENEVEEGGDQSGYLQTRGWVNLSYYPIGSSYLDLEFPYYEYVPPTEGPIFGFVRYNDGPKDGEFVEGAEVRLFNETMVEMGVTTTNASGYYEFVDIPFGEIYDLRVTPPLDELGVNLEITGYLPWDYGFWHNISNRINASVKYYEYQEPASPHPEVTILDDDGDPVEGAQVEVTIEGATYTAKTNMFGIAVFESLDMEEFPSGTEFKASKEGYDDIEWKQGDDIPQFRESQEEDPIWLLVLIVVIVLVIIGAAAFLIFLRKGPEEVPEE